jgi:hypothetical protein
MHHRKLVTAARWVRSGFCVALGGLLACGFFGSARADTCPSPTTTSLPPQPIRLGGGDAPQQRPDLTITGLCTVNKAGIYNYGQVNIVGGGHLFFQEPADPNTLIDFWASSIVVEANGDLTVGSYTTPYGANGGFLTFYLYGKDQSGGQDPAKNPGQGVLCKTSTPGLGPCGIPLPVWTDNGVTRKWHATKWIPAFAWMTRKNGSSRSHCFPDRDTSGRLAAMPDGASSARSVNLASVLFDRDRGAATPRSCRLDPSQGRV